ncbi:uncharacterized protein SPSK_07359 [Sporothrix schenckii 1099-18]|uniref:Uncharacterized protein n=1 Tax=Sporothrix schenckii 1099-18 TaxID=1397361 RepID=A0A0F2MF77_SPOSC|nr:uncharacterized protein SPSK_07359 [Sporothrix schenckii 1099-18]KJR87734.1 hypothetical protein SPSK_07359 [Sporothrix schenckii 1099-18]
MAPGFRSVDAKYSCEDVTAAIAFDEAAGWQMRPGRADKGAPCLRCVARPGQDLAIRADLRGICQLVWNTQHDLRSKYDAAKNQSGTVTSEAKARELALVYAKVLAASDALRRATGVSSAAPPKPKDGGIHMAVEPAVLLFMCTSRLYREMHRGVQDAETENVVESPACVGETLRNKVHAKLVVSGYISKAESTTIMVRRPSAAAAPAPLAHDVAGAIIVPNDLAPLPCYRCFRAAFSGSGPLAAPACVFAGGSLRCLHTSCRGKGICWPLPAMMAGDCQALLAIVTAVLARICGLSSLAMAREYTNKTDVSGFQRAIDVPPPSMSLEVLEQSNKACNWLSTRAFVAIASSQAALVLRYSASITIVAEMYMFLARYGATRKDQLLFQVLLLK